MPFPIESPTVFVFNGTGRFPMFHAWALTEGGARMNGRTYCGVPTRYGVAVLSKENAEKFAAPCHRCYRRNLSGQWVERS